MKEWIRLFSDVVSRAFYGPRNAPGNVPQEDEWKAQAAQTYPSSGASSSRGQVPYDPTTTAQAAAASSLPVPGNAAPPPVPSRGNRQASASAFPLVSAEDPVKIKARQPGNQNQSSSSQSAPTDASNAWATKSKAPSRSRDASWSEGGQDRGRGRGRARGRGRGRGGSCDSSASESRNAKGGQHPQKPSSVSSPPASSASSSSSSVPPQHNARNSNSSVPPRPNRPGSWRQWSSSLTRSLSPRRQSKQTLVDSDGFTLVSKKGKPGKPEYDFSQNEEVYDDDGCYNLEEDGTFKVELEDALDHQPVEFQSPSTQKRPVFHETGNRNRASKENSIECPSSQSNKSGNAAENHNYENIEMIDGKVIPKAKKELQSIKSRKSVGEHSNLAANKSKSGPKAEAMTVKVISDTKVEFTKREPGKDGSQDRNKQHKTPVESKIDNQALDTKANNSAAALKDSGKGGKQDRNKPNKTPGDPKVQEQVPPVSKANESGLPMGDTKPKKNKRRNKNKSKSGSRDKLEESGIQEVQQLDPLKESEVIETRESDYLLEHYHARKAKIRDPPKTSDNTVNGDLCSNANGTEIVKNDVSINSEVPDVISDKKADRISGEVKDVIVNGAIKVCSKIEMSLQDVNVGSHAHDNQGVSKVDDKDPSLDNSHLNVDLTNDYYRLVNIKEDITSCDDRDVVEDIDSKESLMKAQVFAPGDGQYEFLPNIEDTEDATLVVSESDSTTIDSFVSDELEVLDESLDKKDLKTSEEEDEAQSISLLEEELSESSNEVPLESVTPTINQSWIRANRVDLPVEELENLENSDKTNSNITNEIQEQDKCNNYKGVEPEKTEIIVPGKRGSLTETNDPNYTKEKGSLAEADHSIPVTSVKKENKINFTEIDDQNDNTKQNASLTDTDHSILLTLVNMEKSVSFTETENSHDTTKQKASLAETDYSMPVTSVKREKRVSFTETDDLNDTTKEKASLAETDHIPVTSVKREKRVSFSEPDDQNDTKETETDHTTASSVKREKRVSFSEPDDQNDTKETETDHSTVSSVKREKRVSFSEPDDQNDTKETETDHTTVSSVKRVSFVDSGDDEHQEVGQSAEESQVDAASEIRRKHPRKGRKGDLKSLSHLTDEELYEILTMLDEDGLPKKGRKKKTAQEGEEKPKRRVKKVKSEENEGDEPVGEKSSGKRRPRPKRKEEDEVNEMIDKDMIKSENEENEGDEPMAETSRGKRRPRPKRKEEINEMIEKHDRSENEGDEHIGETATVKRRPRPKKKEEEDELNEMIEQHKTKPKTAEESAEKKTNFKAYYAQMKEECREMMMMEWKRITQEEENYKKEEEEKRQEEEERIKKEEEDRKRVEEEARRIKEEEERLIREEEERIWREEEERIRIIEEERMKIEEDKRRIREEKERKKREEEERIRKEQERIREEEERVKREARMVIIKEQMKVEEEDRKRREKERLKRETEKYLKVQREIQRRKEEKERKRREKEKERGSKITLEESQGEYESNDKQEVTEVEEGREAVTKEEGSEAMQVNEDYEEATKEKMSEGCNKEVSEVVKSEETQMFGTEENNDRTIEEEDKLDQTAESKETDKKIAKSDTFECMETNDDQPKLDIASEDEKDSEEEKDSEDENSVEEKPKTDITNLRDLIAEKRKKIAQLQSNLMKSNTISKEVNDKASDFDKNIQDSVKETSEEGDAPEKPECDAKGNRRLSPEGAEAEEGNLWVTESAATDDYQVAPSLLSIFPDKMHDQDLKAQGNRDEITLKMSISGDVILPEKQVVNSASHWLDDDDVVCHATIKLKDDPSESKDAWVEEKDTKDENKTEESTEHFEKGMLKHEIIKNDDKVDETDYEEDRRERRRKRHEEEKEIQERILKDLRGKHGKHFTLDDDELKRLAKEERRENKRKKKRQDKEKRKQIQELEADSINESQQRERVDEKSVDLNEKVVGSASIIDKVAESKDNQLTTKKEGDVEQRDANGKLSTKQESGDYTRLSIRVKGDVVETKKEIITEHVKDLGKVEQNISDQSVVSKTEVADDAKSVEEKTVEPESKEETSGGVIRRRRREQKEEPASTGYFDTFAGFQGFNFIKKFEEIVAERRKRRSQRLEETNNAEAEDKEADKGVRRRSRLSAAEETLPEKSCKETETIVTENQPAVITENQPAVITENQPTVDEVTVRRRRRNNESSQAEGSQSESFSSKDYNEISAQRRRRRRPIDGDSSQTEDRSSMYISHESVCYDGSETSDKNYEEIFEKRRRLRRQRYANLHKMEEEKGPDGGVDHQMVSRDDHKSSPRASPSNRSPVQSVESEDSDSESDDISERTRPKQIWRRQRKDNSMCLDEGKDIADDVSIVL